MKVIPAILTKTSKEFENQIKILSPFFPRYQIDIADDTLVPNKTIQIEDIYSIITRNSQLVTPRTSFDFHLMVTDYEAEIRKIEKLKNFLKIGVIFVHVCLNPDYELITANHPDFSFGFALNPEDKVEAIRNAYDLNKIKNLQIMTIQPGFQGKALIPDLLEKIEQLRLSNYRSNIYIDGGVNEKTIPLIKNLKYRPNFLCIGSYLTHAGDELKTRIDFLNKITVET